MYKASQQPSSEVGIRRRLNEDLYLNFAGMRSTKAVFQAFVFPLVCWIWIGYWVLLFGYDHLPGSESSRAPPGQRNRESRRPVPR